MCKAHAAVILFDYRGNGQVCLISMHQRMGLVALALLVIFWVGVLLIRSYGKALPFSESEKLPPAESARQIADQASGTGVSQDLQNETLGADSAGQETKYREMPKEVNLDVPFTSQAPFANWDTLHEEACEETAALMVRWYYQGITSVAPTEADEAILDFVESEKSILGFYEDTNADELVQVIKKKWGYKSVRMLENPTVVDLKSELASGRPVIVLAAGRMLGNPFYTQPGPVYHALVLKGYTKDGRFITNDPGTKRGADYLYKPDVIINAMHEWNGGDVLRGLKMAIVIDAVGH